jgi:hypothetical protein
MALLVHCRQAGPTITKILYKQKDHTTAYKLYGSDQTLSRRPHSPWRRMEPSKGVLSTRAIETLKKGVVVRVQGSIVAPTHALHQVVIHPLFIFQLRACLVFGNVGLGLESTATRLPAGAIKRLASRYGADMPNATPILTFTFRRMTVASPRTWWQNVCGKV